MNSGKELKDRAAIDWKVSNSLGIFRRGAANERKLYEHGARNSNTQNISWKGETKGCPYDVFLETKKV